MFILVHYIAYPAFAVYRRRRVDRWWFLWLVVLVGCVREAFGRPDAGGRGGGGVCRLR